MCQHVLVVQIVFWLLWIVLGCPGCLRLFRFFLAALDVLVVLGYLVLRSDVLRLFMLFQVVLNCSGC